MKKRVLLYLSGWGQSHEPFRPLMEKLESVFSPIHFELAGFGGRRDEPGSFTFDRYSADLAEFIHTKIGDRPFVLLGWSMGGEICAKYVLEKHGLAPESLILLSSTPRFVDPDKNRNLGQHPTKMKKMIRMMQSDPTEGLKAFIGMFFTFAEEQRPKETESFRKLLIPSPKHFPLPAALIETLKELESVDLLSEFGNSGDSGVKVLAVSGETDTIAPAGGVKLWRKLFKNCQVVEFEKCGHVPLLTETDRLSRLIENFITDELPDKKKILARSFDKGSRSYDETAIFQNEMADRLLDKIEKEGIGPEKGVAIDIGCATGRLGAALYNSGNFGSVIGLDISPMMAQLCRKKMTGTLVADAEALPFRKGSVDFAVSGMSMQWFESPDRFFRELAYVLKKGAVFYGTTLTEGTYGELHSAIMRLAENQDIGHHIVRFAPVEGIVKTAKSAGFEISTSTEKFVKTYPDLMTLLKIIKATGTKGYAGVTGFGLGGRKFIAALEQEIKKEGVIGVTYNVTFIRAVRNKNR